MRTGIAALILLPSLAFAQDAPEPMRIDSYAALVQMLTKDNIQFEPDDNSQLVVCPTSKEGVESAIVIRFALEDGVVHFVAIMPLEVPADRLPAVESAMIRMNHGYPVPGLGFNHDTGTMYFRLTAPVLPRGFLDEAEVKEYFGYTINQTIALMPTMRAIINGDVEPKNVMAYHNALQRGPATPQGTYQREMAGSTWSLEFGEEGAVRLSRDNQVVVLSNAVIEGNQITFTDKAGPLSVENAGVYQFAIDGNGLTFQKVDDAANGRVGVLTGGAWAPVQ